MVKRTRLIADGSAGYKKLVDLVSLSSDKVVDILKRRRIENLGWIMEAFSHDIGNYINAMLGFSTLVRKADSLESASNYNENIYNAGLEASELLKSITSIRRDQRNNNEKVSLGDICKHVLHAVQYQFRKSGIIFENDINSKAEAYFNEGDIQQFLITVFREILEYHHAGSTRPEKITLKCGKNEDFVFVECSYWGMPVELERLEILLDMIDGCKEVKLEQALDTASLLLADIVKRNRAVLEFELRENNSGGCLRLSLPFR
jgi:signal transduction histidine kinase